MREGQRKGDRLRWPSDPLRQQQLDAFLPDRRHVAWDRAHREGQIRQLITPGVNTAADKHRYLAVAPKVSGKPWARVQIQLL
jgi:hypothetical protein